MPRGQDVLLHDFVSGCKTACYKGFMEKAQHRSGFEKMTNQGNRFASPEKPRMSFVIEALKVENFPLVVLILLATISLISRIWLMLH